MLNFRDILVVFALIHILGNFYFQIDSTKEEKEKNLKKVLYHCIIYGFLSFVLMKLIIPNFDDPLLLLFATGHTVIEVIKFYFVKKDFKINSCGGYIFSIEQLVHLLLMIVISYYAIKSGKAYEYNVSIESMMTVMGTTVGALVPLSLKVLLVHKPVNSFIASILGIYKSEDEEDTVKAGRMIGSLERIIILFFLILQQYSSVGLVLTAKSIARYNKIAEDQQFAESYLLGTLLSTICVLCVSLI